MSSSLARIGRTFIKNNFPATTARFLPECLKASPITFYDHEDAQRISSKIRSVLQKKQFNRLSNADLEFALFFYSLTARYNLIWDLCSELRNSRCHNKLITPSTYILLLQAICRSKDKRMVSHAVNIYAELYSGPHLNLTSHQHDFAAQCLLTAFQRCHDFTALVLLKALYENCISRFASNELIELLYLAAFLHTHLNTGQYSEALKLWNTTFTTYKESKGAHELMNSLPFVELLQAMCTNQDLSSLALWLEVLLKIDPDLDLVESHWPQFLSAAIDNSHYPTVHLIYSQFIMKGHKEISVDEVLFSTKFEKLQKNNTPLNTMADETLYQILHVLSTHGDITSTQNLIQWHHIYKSWKGENSMTKDLTIQILSAHCHNIHTSFESILDIIHSFSTKSNQHLSYKDITDSISHKWFTLDMEDQFVKAAKANELEIIKTIEQAEESKPRKISNPNLAASTQGNILSNTRILDAFVYNHVTYTLENHHSEACLQLFVNCVLNHINRYQNVTGMAVALSAIQRGVNDRRRTDTSFFSAESLDIMCSIISKSRSARLCGHEIFKFARRIGFSISLHNYERLMQSVKGSHLTDLLRIYQDACMQDLGQLPPRFCRKETGLSAPTDPEVYTQEEKDIHEKYYGYDVRDCGYLRFALRG